MNSATTMDRPRPRRRRHGRQTRFLAQSILLEEIGPPNILRVVLFLAGAALAALIAWAYVSPLAERVRASGQVVPSGAILAVQHWEGGLVAEIPVKEGAVVEPGTVLVRLDPTASTAEHEETRTRIAALSLRAERLRAFAEGREPDFAAAAPSGGFDGLITDQAQIYRYQVVKRESEREVLSHVIEQRMSELDSLRTEEKTIAEEVGIVEELATMREGLVKKGLISRVVYLGTMQQLVASRGALRKNRSEAARARQAIAEAKQKRVQLDAELRSAALSEMGQITAELAQLRRLAEKSEDKVARLDIRSPVHGVVKRLVPNTIGGVIVPGSLVAEIVPLDAELVAEVRVSPDDIGQLHPGLPVSVRVSAYDFYRYGEVDGTLERISASTFETEEGARFYKATIRLKTGYVGGDPSANPVLPGMTIDAHINTGERTVLQYLLKPIYLSISDAFGER